MKHPYLNARDGIRELSRALGNAEARSVLFYVLSDKWIQLIPVDPDASKTMLIRTLDENTIGYRLQISGSDSRLESFAEVSNTPEGNLRFIEKGESFTPAAFATQLVELALTCAL